VKKFPHLLKLSLSLSSSQGPKPLSLSPLFCSQQQQQQKPAATAAKASSSSSKRPAVAATKASSSSSKRQQQLQQPNSLFPPFSSTKTPFYSPPQTPTYFSSIHILEKVPYSSKKPLERVKEWSRLNDSVVERYQT